MESSDIVAIDQVNSLSINSGDDSSVRGLSLYVVGFLDEQMSPSRSRCPAALAKGDARWFHEDKGLNNRGYVLGAAALEGFTMPTTIASKSMCEARWGLMKGGKF